jgi:hypothetical protein
MPILLSATVTGKVIIESSGDCFEDHIDGKCEVSGVEATDNRLFFVNDKQVDGYSSLFSTDRSFLDHNYIYSEKVDSGRKFEDLAIYKDHLIITTAFDRKEKGYNRVIGYNLKDGSSYRIAGKKFRKRVKRVIGRNYFKIEGVEVVRNRLFFGIREVGESYKDFHYTVTTLSVGFQVVNGKIELCKDIEIYEELRISNLGLSSLKYDKVNEILYLLTSVEVKGQYGGYIFYIKNGEMQLLRDKLNIPITLHYKAEGVTLLDSDHLLVVYDDDRRLKDRKKNQFRYSVIRLNRGN